MDNQITLKFFKVNPSEEFGISFEDAITEAWESGQNPAQREQDINAGFAGSIIIRLERLNNQRSFISGELIRKQTSNIPPEANDSGLTRIRLGRGGGLGLSSAFRYHKDTGVILIQNNRQAVSHSRMSLYLKCINSAADFDFGAVPTEDAWERFNDGEPRRIRMRLGAPTSFVNLRGDARTIGRSVATIGEALHAPYITIEVSMGHQRGSLAEDQSRGLIDALLRKREESPETVTSVTASVSDDDGNDKIDFLQEQLVVKDTLDLDDADPARNYEVRAAFLQSTFNDHIRYIRQTYG